MGEEGRRVVTNRLHVWANKLAFWKSDFSIAQKELPSITVRIRALSEKLKTTPNDADALTELTLLQSKREAVL